MHQITQALGKVARETSKFAHRSMILPGAQLFTSTYNAGLPDKEKISCIYDLKNSTLPTPYLASPLAWPGYGLALASASTVTILVDNTRSLALGIQTLIKAGDNQEQDSVRILYKKDKRHAAKIYAVGFPGYVAGLALSVPVHLLADGARSLAWVFKAIYSAGLDEKACDFRKANDSRHWAKKVFSGLLGIVLGGAIAIPITILIDSLKSLILGFRTLPAAGNKSQSDALQKLYETDQKNRKPVKIYLSGLAGYLLGIALSIPFSLLVDGARSLKWAFAYIYNAGLDKDNACDRIKNNDKRHIAKKILTGSIGMILGALFAILATPIVDSTKSFVLGLQTLLSAGKNTENPGALKELYAADEQNRNAFKIYGSGLPGYLLGLTLGIPINLIVDGAKSFAWMFRLIYNLGLNKKACDSISPINDKRHWAKKVFSGFVGTLLGAIAGFPITFLIDMAKSFVLGFKTLFSAGRSVKRPLVKDAYGINRFHRHWAKTFIAGSPGYITGLLLSLPASFIVESIQSFALACKTIFQPGWNTEKPGQLKATYESLTRHKARAFTFGLPGYLLGIACASIASLFADGARSFMIAFKAIYNAGLNPKAKDFIKTQTDKRHALRQYLPGIPGLLLGGICGVVAKTISLIARFTADILKYFAMTSRSLFNVATGTIHFKQLRDKCSIAATATIGDKEGEITPNTCLATLEKPKTISRGITRAIGSTLAALTVSVPCLIVRILKEIPNFLVMSLGLAFSPITAIGRVIYNKSCKKARFFQPEGEEALAPSLEQKFKNLFSSINGAGQLTTREPIRTNGTGTKSRWNSARKCFFSFYATKTPTEEILDDLWNELKTMKQNDITEQTFHSVAEQCQARLRSCVFSKEVNQRITNEISKVSSFVKGYILGDSSENASLNTEFYSSICLSAKDLWNGEDNRSASAATTAA